MCWIGTLTTFNDSTTQEVNWHRHMMRVDLVVDYYNTNLKVEPLANKVTRTKEIEVYRNIIDGLIVAMSNRSRAVPYAHMNNGCLKPQTLDDPRVVPNTGIINCWNNRRMR